MAEITILKLLLIGLILNTLENVILLLFFKVPFSKDTFLFSFIFALALLIIYEGYSYWRQR